MTIVADTTNANANAIVGRAMRLEELENYNSCKIWLEGYNSPAQRMRIRFTFHYFANITTLTLIL